jgi:glycogen phosphorylase
MKVIYNGGLNCSILDGWWAEAYSPDVGWAIGAGEEYKEAQSEQQDQIESQALYDTLENDLIPLFYERARDGLPRGWIGKVKASIKKLAPAFTTRRMVREYADFFYLPTYERIEAMTSPDLHKGIDYAAWRSNIGNVWRDVRVKSVNISQDNIKVGAETEVHAVIDLGQLKPSDVRVQLYYGKLDTDGTISEDAQAVDMTMRGQNGGSEYHYVGNVRYHTSGDRGISVRVVPHHEFLPTPFQPGLITWA